MDKGKVVAKELWDKFFFVFTVYYAVWSFVRHSCAVAKDLEDVKTNKAGVMITVKGAIVQRYIAQFAKRVNCSLGTEYEINTVARVFWVK